MSPTGSQTNIDVSDRRRTRVLSSSASPREKPTKALFADEEGDPEDMVTFIVEGKPIKVSRRTIEGVEVFEAMFSSVMKEGVDATVSFNLFALFLDSISQINQVEVPNYLFSIVRKMLSFIETDYVFIENTAEALEILRAADQYQVLRLKSFCIDYIKQVCRKKFNRNPLLTFDTAQSNSARIDGEHRGRRAAGVLAADTRFEQHLGCKAPRYKEGVLLQHPHQQHHRNSNRSDTLCAEGLCLRDQEILFLHGTDLACPCHRFQKVVYLFLSFWWFLINSLRSVLLKSAICNKAGDEKMARLLLNLGAKPEVPLPSPHMQSLTSPPPLSSLNRSSTYSWR